LAEKVRPDIGNPSQIFFLGGGIFCTGGGGKGIRR
jgi:hypothetical protein